MILLLEEENLISLRKAFVFEDDRIVHFALQAANLYPEFFEGAERADVVGKDSTFLYRRLRSPSEEKRLRTDYLESLLDVDIKPMAFESSPRFRLLWTDSGESVALFLNEEPWAFIDEKTHQGYSKGILGSSAGNLWDQVLFEKIFAL